MRRTAFLLCLLLAGQAALATEGQVGELDGEKVILFPDQTWRYDDSGGPRCTDLGLGRQVCALPSDWSPVPGPTPRGERRWFMHGTDLRATFWTLGGPKSGRFLTPEDVRAFINRDRGKDNDHGLTTEVTEAKLAGQTPFTLASVIGTNETRVYSLVQRPDGTVLLALTVETPSFQYSVAHKALHASFLNAIRIGETP